VSERARLSLRMRDDNAKRDRQDALTALQACQLSLFLVSSWTFRNLKEKFGT
jgi:hypothetical protein